MTIDAKDRLNLLEKEVQMLISEKARAELNLINATTLLAAKEVEYKRLYSELMAGQGVFWS